MIYYCKTDIDEARVANLFSRGSDRQDTISETRKHKNNFMSKLKIKELASSQSQYASTDYLDA